MPWYYAGPEAKPIGPVSLEELHALRIKGTLTPDTFVIEHTGTEGESPAWKRYHEAFPVNPILPPLPAAAFLPPAMALQPPPAPAPLFPSAPPAPRQNSVFTSPARPDPYYKAQKTNEWCAWGFGLALTSIPLVFVCCIGALVAPLGLIVCITGLFQLRKNGGQAGRGLAIAGLCLSIAALILTVILMAWVFPRFFHENSMSFEQNVSETQ